MQVCMLPSVLVHPSIWMQSFHSGLHTAISLSSNQQEVAEQAVGPGSCAHPLQASAMEHPLPVCWHSQAAGCRATCWNFYKNVTMAGTTSCACPPL